LRAVTLGAFGVMPLACIPNIGIVTFTICFSMQEKYKEEVVKQYGESFNYEEKPIDGQAVYASGGEKAHRQ
jgi:hypothetical protein